MMAIDEICQRGSVRDADVAMLRRALMRETEFKAGDADSLFRIHELCRVQDPAWPELFVSVLTDYVVREFEPSGYLTAVHGGWLIARLSRNGRVTSKAELDLLLNVLDKARWAPESLVGFALAQVRVSVVSGEGPLRGGLDVPAGAISAVEVEFLRRILLATSAEGMSDLTRIEVETVLDIDGEVVPTEQACDLEARLKWRELVSQVIANAAMSASGYVGPIREQGFRAGAALWLMPADPPRAVQLVGREAGSILASCRRLSPEEKALQRLERQRVEIITGEPARDIDGAWLAERIRLGEQRGRSFADVLAALNACGAVLHPAIAELAQRGVRAA
jgi:hypothetical protein